MRRARAALFALCLVPAIAGGPAAAKGPVIENDIIVRSADGTPLVATLMLPEGASADAPVPAILGTHGWGGTRATSPSGLTQRLLDNGYAILTWDSRGFGESGGEANVGAPGFEVEDAKALMSYLASRPEILTDGPDDPRVGWIGGSNAAGVQFNTAALDHRIEAIVPEISWGNLIQDLTPNGVAKQTWNDLLYGAGLATGLANGLQSSAGPQTGAYPPQIHQGFVEITTTGKASKPIEDWFSFRATTTRSADIRTPTLIIQGTVDVLFPLEDAFANYLNIKKSKTPVKVIAYCAGHTLAGCSYPGGATGYPAGSEDKPPIYQDRIVSWLDRYVKGKKKVNTGPEIEWQAQDGLYYGAKRYPLPKAQTLSFEPVSTGTLFGPGPGGGDGPSDGNPAPAGELGRSARRDVVVAPPAQTLSILGVPQVKLTGSVTGAAAHVFLELVDVAPDGTRVTVDDQVMPVALGSGAFDRTVDLHGIAWRLEPGHSLELEITTGSAQYAAPRTGPYAVSLAAELSLPISKT
ncbi:MAG: CocE/NonD family hydrolase [Actinomycetota bacterium]